MNTLFTAIVQKYLDKFWQKFLKLYKKVLSFNEVFFKNDLLSRPTGRVKPVCDV